MILFISGTDTGVGKTTVACAITRILRRRGISVGVAKPIATGSTMDRHGRKVSMDAVKLMRAAGHGLPIDRSISNERHPHPLMVSLSNHERPCYENVNPILFDPPISPHLASRLASRPISLGNLRAHLYNMERRHDVLLVEGIGGVATPLTDRKSWADFVSMFNHPRTILVCSPKIGALNHTLLSLEYLARRKVDCPGLILSKYRSSQLRQIQNRQELARLTGVPVGTLSMNSLRLTGDTSWIRRLCNPN